MAGNATRAREVICFNARASVNLRENTNTILHIMDVSRRSERKRTQTDFLGATETLRDARRSGRRDEAQAKASRAHEAAVGNAYEPLGGLVQLGAVGGEGRVWVGEPGEDGAEDSPALGGFLQRAAHLIREAAQPLWGAAKAACT
jgi:hypothetical protein